MCFRCSYSSEFIRAYLTTKFFSNMESATFPALSVIPRAFKHRSQLHKCSTIALFKQLLNSNSCSALHDIGTSCTSVGIAENSRELVINIKEEKCSLFSHELHQ